MLTVDPAETKRCAPLIKELNHQAARPAVEKLLPSCAGGARRQAYIVKLGHAGRSQQSLRCVSPGLRLSAHGTHRFQYRFLVIDLIPRK